MTDGSIALWAQVNQLKGKRSTLVKRKNKLTSIRSSLNDAPVDTINRKTSDIEEIAYKAVSTFHGFDTDYASFCPKVSDMLSYVEDEIARLDREISSLNSSISSISSSAQKAHDDYLTAQAQQNAAAAATP